MGGGRRRFDGGDRLKEGRGCDGLLRLKAVLPGRRANMRVDTLLPVSDSTTRSDTHDLDHSAAGSTCATWNGQKFTAIRSFGLVVPEAGEYAVLVVHGRPVRRGEAAPRCRKEAWWSINDSLQCKIAEAIGLLNFGCQARKTRP
jgi:hypothetical protein